MSVTLPTKPGFLVIIRCSYALRYGSRMPGRSSFRLQNLAAFPIVACLTLSFQLNLLGAEPGLEDWPKFLGPRGDNTSMEMKLVDRWPPKGPALVWEKDIGSGYSAPSVREGKLVLHHRVGEDEIIAAMDSATGTPEWHNAYA